MVTEGTTIRQENAPKSCSFLMEIRIKSDGNAMKNTENVGLSYTKRDILHPFLHPTSSMYKGNFGRWV